MPDNNSPNPAERNKAGAGALPEAHRDPHHPRGDYENMEAVKGVVARHQTVGQAPEAPDATPSMEISPENAPVAASGADVDQVVNPSDPEKANPDAGSAGISKTVPESMTEPLNSNEPKGG